MQSKHVVQRVLTESVAVGCSFTILSDNLPVTKYVGGACEAAVTANNLASSSSSSSSDSDEQLAISDVSHHPNSVKRA